MQGSAVVDKQGARVSPTDSRIRQMALRVVVDEVAPIQRDCFAGCDGSGAINLAAIIAIDGADGPCLEAIDIRRLLATARMLAARLASIFNIDTEDDGFFPGFALLV